MRDADNTFASCPTNNEIGMHHSGIGGGARNGTFESVDFREKAPAAAFQDMYNDKVNASIYGGLARYEMVQFPWCIL